jgi:hypothetical protein
LAASTPDLRTSVSASDTAWIVSATTTWLAALATCPEPGGPMCVTALPITSRIGRARSTASSLPPTMIARSPDSAAGWPPETGASTASTPFSSSASCTWRAVAGAMLDMSM